MVKIKLTKLTDDVFEGNHPNGINEGYTKKGYMIEKPKVGYPFTVYAGKLYPCFWTSTVKKKMNKEGIFKTTYSTYKIEIIDNN